MAVTSIPAVDLSKFANGNEAQRKEFIAELGKAWKDVGFVTVKNHGVPDEYINAFYTQVKRFFEFDTATKLNYEDAENAGQRGYTSFGREHAKGFDAPDLKEFWQNGRTHIEGKPLPSYPDNVWPDEEITQFRPNVDDLFLQMEKMVVDWNSLVTMIGLSSTVTVH